MIYSFREIISASVYGNVNIINFVLYGTIILTNFSYKKAVTNTYMRTYRKEKNSSSYSLPFFSEERLISRNFSRKVIAITRTCQHQRIVKRARIFPRDYRDPLSRGYICSRGWETVGQNGGFSIALFIFVPITIAARADFSFSPLAERPPRSS